MRSLCRLILLLASCTLLLFTAALCEETAPLLTQETDDYAFIIQSAEISADQTLLQVRCENQTDHPLTFGWSHVSVMGCMLDPLWAVTVDPSSATDAQIRFDGAKLQAVGVTSPDEITFTLNVLDAFSWDKGKLLEQEYILYPTGTIPPPIERLHAPDERVLLDDADLLFTILHAELVPFNGYILDVCLENRTDRYVMARIASAEANNVEVDPMWADELYAGKRLYTQIKIPQYQLSSANITQIESLTLTLQLCDLADWLRPCIKEATVGFVE